MPVTSKWLGWRTDIVWQGICEFHRTWYEIDRWRLQDATSGPYCKYISERGRVGMADSKGHFELHPNFWEAYLAEARHIIQNAHERMDSAYQDNNNEGKQQAIIDGLQRRLRELKLEWNWRCRKDF